MIGFSVELSNKNLAMKNADRIFCPKCNSILKFTENNFYCEQCGFKKIKAEYLLRENSSLEFNGESIGTPIVGKYNFYNLAAALAAFDVTLVGARHDVSLQKLLEGFHPAFGRFEKIPYKKHFFHVILAKNPAGMDNVLATLQGDASPTNLLICLNDKIADGEDVSWIYDADFENLFDMPQQIIFSGTRAYDLTLRLKIVGKLPEKHAINEDMAVSFEKFLEGVTLGEKSAAIVTYTCLMELQKIMYHKKIIKKIM